MARDPRGRWRLAAGGILLLAALAGCASTSPPSRRAASHPIGQVGRIAPPLRTVARALEGGANPARYRSGPVRVDAAGRIEVYVHVIRVSPRILARLRACGLHGIVSSRVMKVVEGWSSPRRLEALARLSFVSWIGPPSYGHPEGPP